MIPIKTVYEISNVSTCRGTCNGNAVMEDQKAKR
jgi:hypothetical protein